MTESQFLQYSTTMLWVSLALMLLSVLRYKRYGVQSLYLTSAFGMLALTLWGMTHQWALWTRIVCLVALAILLVLDAMSRIGRKGTR
jgi:ACR3 family arsenite efflux pump ArsB